MIEKPCDNRIVSQYCRRKVIVKNNQNNLKYEINKGNLSKVFIQNCHHKNIKANEFHGLEQNINYCQVRI